MSPVVMHPDLSDVLPRFFACTLPEHEWTHAAHVTVCVETVDRLGASAALAALRRAIIAFNDTIGTPNTDTSGYHETLSRYYVGTIGDLIDGVATVDLAAILADPACSRDAPLRHWSRSLLFSAEARRGWVPPDLAPLPWA